MAAGFGIVSECRGRSCAVGTHHCRTQNRRAPWLSRQRSHRRSRPAVFASLVGPAWRPDRDREMTHDRHDYFPGSRHHSRSAVNTTLTRAEVIPIATIFVVLFVVPPMPPSPSSPMSSSHRDRSPDRWCGQRRSGAVRCGGRCRRPRLPLWRRPRGSAGRARWETRVAIQVEAKGTAAAISAGLEKPRRHQPGALAAHGLELPNDGDEPDRDHEEPGQER